MFAKVKILALMTLTVLACGVASAQECSHTAGHPWTDGFGFVWTLDQDGSGNVSGSVLTNCQQWYVSGVMHNNGTMDITATNPSPYYWDPVTNEYYSCNSWFAYTGAIVANGCQSGSGTWYNDYNYSGAWSWYKQCEAPSGEQTQVGSLPQPGEPLRTAWRYLVTVSGGTGPNFGGRKIQEWTAQPGEDTCDISGDQFPAVTTLQGPNGPVEGAGPVLDNGNSFSDTVGWSEGLVTYYRAAASAGEIHLPCHFKLYQQMTASCIVGPLPYKTNALISEIWPDAVVNTRAGIPKIVQWP